MEQNNVQPAPSPSNRRDKSRISSVSESSKLSLINPNLHMSKELKREKKDKPGSLSSKTVSPKIDNSPNAPFSKRNSLSVASTGLFSTSVSTKERTNSLGSVFF